MSIDSRDIQYILVIFTCFIWSCFAHIERYRQATMPSQTKYLTKTVSNVCETRRLNIPLLITFLSTYQSPKTVNKNAKELVIGTVKLSSTIPLN